MFRQAPPLSRNSSTSLSLTLSVVMQPEPPFSDITIHLRRSVVQSVSSPSSTLAITVPLSGGVDLGLVGHVLGLDPNAVRLNGYYVSCNGPRHVSPGLLWGQLLDFFAQKGLPCGTGKGDAIIVQGKHMGSSDGNPYMKRKFYLETECPLKKRKIAVNFKPNKNASLSTKRSLEFQLQIESPPKKRNVESNYKSDANGSAKRCLNSDDVSVPFKKQKIRFPITGIHKSYTATASQIPIFLHLYSSVSSSRPSPLMCTISVSLASSVDLGLVGRVLGLDPKTVHLNGYYVSRILPHYVSPSLSWGILLNFFAQRRLPCGSEVQDAIVVQGKYVGPTDSNLISKRKVGLEAECSLKKIKLTNPKPDESVINSIKRIIVSDNSQDTFKRMKIAYCSRDAHKSHTSMHVRHPHLCK